MSHEAGIDEAAKQLAPMAYAWGGTEADKHTARNRAIRVIAAYLFTTGSSIVPVVPNEEMMDAGYGDNHFGDHDPYGAYMRMIAAAPNPFQRKGE